MSDAFFLVGPTAVGKTKLVHELAQHLKLRVLSTDSMQVYRGMDIGTAKPTAEERKRFGYLGLDLVGPDETWSTGQYLQAVAASLAPMETVVASGGTGLYLRALTQGLNEAPAGDPELRREIEALFAAEGLAGLHDALDQVHPNWRDGFTDPQNPRRLMRAWEIARMGRERPRNWNAQPKPQVVGLTRPRAALHQRIEQRVEQMFALGLVEEVRNLLHAHPQWSATAEKAIGYAEVRALLAGELNEAEAQERIIVRTRQLAKRQMTWFRHQLNVHWIEADATDAPQQVLQAWQTSGTTPLNIGA